MRCDIVMPVWNKRKLTEQCLAGIFQHTRGEYSVIIIDNASDEPAAEYMRDVSRRHPDKIKLIRNSHNAGFTKAVNQGIRASSGGYVCILNNDTVVSDDWLGEMIRIAESSPEIGIVNPSSNFGAKKPRNITYEQYAAGRTKDKRGQLVETAGPVGFCYLIKREVIDKIGLMDECFNPGYFEDTEYAIRARNAGYKSVFAKGAFVFHFEHASFKKRGFNALFKKSEEKFYAMHKRPERILYVLTRTAPEDFKARVREFLDKGAWVSVYLKKSSPKIELPNHTYARAFYFEDLFFNTKVFLKILFKKKKFTKIFRE